MSEIKLTEDNFKSEVLESDIPVLVDFWAQWCGPCRMLSPIISDLAKDMDGKMKIGKVNVDENPDLTSQYNVSSIPAVFVFRDGAVQKSFVGVRPKEEVFAFAKEFVE